LTKIGLNIGICQGNFQLHWFTTSENMAKSLWGLLFFDSHCTCSILTKFVTTSPE